MRLLFTLLLLLQFVFIKAQPVDSTNTTNKINHFIEAGLYMHKLKNNIYKPKKDFALYEQPTPVGYYTIYKPGFVINYKCKINICKKWSVTAGIGYNYYKVKYDYPQDSVILYKNDIENFAYVNYSDLLANNIEKESHKIDLPLHINYSIKKLDIGIGGYFYYYIYKHNRLRFNNVFFMPALFVTYFIGKKSNIPISIELSSGAKLKIAYVF